MNLDLKPTNANDWLIIFFFFNKMDELYISVPQ